MLNKQPLVQKYAEITYYDIPMTSFGPRPEKTCLRGFRQSETQTSLLGYID